MHASWRGVGSSAVLVCIWALPVVAQSPFELEAEAKAILSNRCLSCHNPEQKTSGLDLSNLDTALQGGAGSRTVLVPGRPNESLMITRVVAGEMPLGSPLPQEEREILWRWGAAGAPWSGTLVAPESKRPRAGPDWWAFQPLAESLPPEPEGIPRAWRGSPIDRFILGKLREKGMRPSPPADRRTLIRRATFDLLGLPPSPAEVETFVNDPSEDTYEKMIDRLLASPHYGERWGRHWMDVVRFGESHGYEQNHIREHAWPYRDYLIRSFNEDKPFKRMIVEQIAGDQVAPDNPDVEVATGFLVAGIHDTVKIENLEGELQQRVNDLDDMISATGAAFLGLTVNCARCHNHKFDPIEQADYYRLQATFAGVRHGERALATAEQKQRRKVLEEPLHKELEAIDARLEALKGEGKPRVDEQRDEIARRYLPAADPKLTEERFTPVRARFIRMTILQAYRNVSPGLDELEVWTDGPSPRNVALDTNGTKATAEATRTAGGDTSVYSVDHINDGKFDKLWISADRGKGRVTLGLPRVETIARVIWSRDRLGANQGRFQFFVPTKYIFEASLDGTRWETLADSDARLPYAEENREELFLLSVFSRAEQDEWNSLRKRKADLNEKLKDLPELSVAYIGRFEQPEEPTRLLKRGNPMNKGEVIAPGSLSAFGPMLPGYALDPKAPEGERRLALARWISDDRNALTSRVLANRLWHYHFGKGFVGTPSDFGFNGERPTHPKLLDWLAGRVYHHGWRLKALHREIMLSATYRQSSRGNAQFADIDRDARFLWRFPPRRLEAEEVRDAILAVSGKLNLKMGGPGFRLYKYTVDNVATYYPLENPGEETYRRGVYHQAARSVKVDLLGAYDCPDSTLPAPKREVTISPLQALNLLNSRFLIDQARFFAARLTREAGETHRAGQVDLAYRLAFGRAPKPEETAAATDLIDRHGLFIFCRALLNANELIYVM